MGKKKSRLLRNRSEFVITPQVRLDHRNHCRDMIKNMDAEYRKSFPASVAIHQLGAWGMPLEWTRWYNANSFKPGAWWKRVSRQITDKWYDLKVWAYRIPPGADAVADLEMFKRYYAEMDLVEAKGKDSYLLDRRKGKFWSGPPGDHIVNREITPPKTHGAYLNGAVRLMFDEDFFAFAVFPYAFREIPLADMLAVMFPDVNDWQFLPDSGTPEYETYAINSYYSSIAMRISMDRHAKTPWERHRVNVVGEDFEIVYMDINGAVVATDHVTRKAVVAKVKKSEAEHHD